MFFSKLTIKKLYVICDAYNKETKEVKTIKGEIGELFSDEDIQELQETLSDISSEECYNENDSYGQILYALESILNDGNEFESVCLYRSLSDSYYNEPLYSAFTPHETADETKPSDQDNEKPRRLAWGKKEWLKMLDEK